MKARITCILISAMISAPVLASVAGAGQSCCCHEYTRTGTSCTNHPVKKNSIIKSKCCCSYETADCGTPQTLDTPTANLTSAKHEILKSFADDAIFFNTGFSCILRRNREGPPPVTPIVRSTTPKYILHCSILC